MTTNPLDGIIPYLVSPISEVEQRELEEQEEREKTKEKNIILHMEQCGSYYHRPDPHNGRHLIAYESACGYWRRGCERCLQSRAGSFKKRFRNCIKDVNGVEFLGIAQMDKAACNKITRRMRKFGTRYWRIPTPVGIILIFDSLHFSDLNNPELYDSIQDDWVNLCQTPPGSRYSGDLGKQTEQEKVGIVVKIPQFRIEKLEEHNINSAWSLTLKNTHELNPSYDIEEIEDALQIRMNSFEESIISMGGEIGEKYRVMARVEEKYFGWKIERNKNLSTLDTNRPLPPPGFVEETLIDPGGPA